MDLYTSELGKYCVDVNSKCVSGVEVEVLGRIRRVIVDVCREYSDKLHEEADFDVDGFRYSVAVSYGYVGFHHSHDGFKFSGKSELVDKVVDRCRKIVNLWYSSNNDSGVYYLWNKGCTRFEARGITSFMKVVCGEGQWVTGDGEVGYISNCTNGLSVVYLVNSGILVVIRDKRVLVACTLDSDGVAYNSYNDGGREIVEKLEMYYECRVGELGPDVLQ